jgi:integrase
MPARAKDGKLMKGRPITAEEFDRMLSKATDVRPADSSYFERLQRGLWLSGLRLEEALELTWDDYNRPRVDLTGRRPLMLIPAEHQKNHTDTLHPVAPEFAEFLEATPEGDRKGYVFPLPFRRKDTVSKIITAIGAAAGIKVNTEARTGKVKFASAHDLRRAFGERWAKRVMPAVLQKLMRHSHIETTLKYYVGMDAETTADTLWEAVAKTAGNTPDLSSIEVTL